MPDHTIQKDTHGLGVWEHFTIQDGLPDMKIESLLDSHGDLWIGTHDCGVARFDGDRFETFTRRDGLAGDEVFSIIEDRERAIWFGTDRGLTRYRNGGFEHVVPSSGELCNFGAGRCMDREGLLWFCVGSQPGSPPRLCRWNGKSLDLVPLPEGKDHLITQIVADTRGNLWLGSMNSLWCYDGETFHFIEAQFGWIVPLLSRPDGSLWVSGNKGLYVYDNGRFEQLGRGVTGNNSIGALVEDYSGAIWLTTHDGRLLRHEDGAFRLIQKLEGVSNRILCLDLKGRLWMACFEKGLYCYDTTRFELFQEEQGLQSNHVYCLTEDNEGVLWVGTYSGLVRYDGATFYPLELEGIGDVTALLRDHQGHIWIGTGQGDLYQYDGKVLHLVLENPKIVGPRKLSSLAEDKTGRIWFGFQFAQSFGYYENGQVHRFLTDRDIDYPSCVRGLLVDRQGAVWIGSWNPSRWEGLCRYDGERFTAFTQANGLADGAINALYEDREGCIWIGTSGGVSRYDGERFTTFTQADGLPYKIVTAIAQTEDSTFWFGTEGGGVCRYDGQVFHVITIPGEPGLNVIYAIYEDSQHQIWFGTEGGLVGYSPHRERPEVVITSVIADRTYEGIQAIELPTTVGRISFCFRGRSTVERTSHLVYRYRLDGYDKEWHQTKEQQVDYPQLSPGEYCFSVQAVDSDLNYSEMASVRLTVTPDPRIVGLTEALRVGGAPGGFIGTSSALQRVLAQTREVASTDLTVLILGETGTGKGLVARAIHGLSERRDKPFIVVNCGAIPESLAESELFGHEKGAFTGAISRKLGRFELAEGGTLFLDEIGDLALSAQVKLLRFIEDRVFERVGGGKELRADVRVLAATNRDLEKMVAKDQFREDLYFRLQEFPIRVPPLRERLEDIPVLVDYFAERFAEHLNLSVPGITKSSLERLRDYTWPGNVRELEHLVQRAVLLCKGGTISAEDIAGVLFEEELPSAGKDFVTLEELERRHEEQERRHIETVLEVTNWVIYGSQGAAEILSINPEKLRGRMRKLGLHRKQ